MAYRSAVRLAWLYRACIQEAVLLGQATGDMVEVADVAAGLAGTPQISRDQGTLARSMKRSRLIMRSCLPAATWIPGQTDDRQADNDDALGASFTVLDDDIAPAWSLPALGLGLEADITTDNTSPANRRPPSPLLSTAALIQAWLRQDRDPDQLIQAVLRRWYRGRHILTPLPSLLGSRAWRAAHKSSPDAFLGTYARAVERSSAQEVLRLQALQGNIHAWHDRIGPRRRHAHIPRALALIAALPWVTPTLLAGRLRITLQSASRILHQMRDLGIVHEISGRTSWKIYAATDIPIDLSAMGARRAGIRAHTQSRAETGTPADAPSGAAVYATRAGASDAPPPVPKRLVFEDTTAAIDFESLYADLDQATRRVEALLATVDRPQAKNQAKKK
jgi:hypothetical protein